MTFTTLTFIVFLVLSFLLYWAIGKRFIQNIFLVIVSYIFYGWWDYRFCLFLFASSLVDYCVGRRMDQTENPRLRQGLLLISLVCNLSVLGFFKYWNFFADSFKSIAAIIGWQPDFVTVNVILPVGISFYTFQTLTYTIDIYRRQLKPAKNLVDYLCYLSFFPQLVAGPIERATHLLPQVLKERSFKGSLAAEGLRQMLWGFFKKMVIADNLAPIVDQTYLSSADWSGPQLAFSTVAFAFQIYCDFSAYSDIATGCARLFGFDLMRNFAYPYFSQSIAEFWRRWHISLSTWLKDYVYIPLGGSRVSPPRRSVNLMMTFLLSGLWHGAAWNFVAWGGLHGGLILTERLWNRSEVLRVNDLPGGRDLLPRPAVLLRILITFTLTCVTWIFFRAAGMRDALTVLRKIVTESFNPAAYQSFSAVFDESPLGGIVPILMVSFVLVEWLQRHQLHPLMIGKWSQPLRWLAYTGMLWLTMYWGTWSTGQFVYFQF
jgi:D-alanyl-lipoteichoic acid acyltransferase DltB (MBOAT superfamily)